MADVVGVPMQMGAARCSPTPAQKTSHVVADRNRSRESGIFPAEAAITRLEAAVLLEQDEPRQLEVRLMFSAESMAAITDLDDLPALLSAPARKLQHPLTTQPRSDEKLDMSILSIHSNVKRDFCTSLTPKSRATLSPCEQGRCVLSFKASQVTIPTRIKII